MTKEEILAKTNQEIEAANAQALEVATRAGKAAPKPKELLELKHLEFPKYVHKGWSVVDADRGCHKAAESKLVHDEAGLKAALAAGFSEEAPKPKKVESKKE